MIYLFAGFLVELIWEFSSQILFFATPDNIEMVIVFAMDLIVFSLFLIGAYQMGKDKTHFKAAYILSIILIAVHCVITVLELSPIDVLYSGFTDLAPVILSLILTYQLVKGFMVHATEPSMKKLAQRLMNYWKAGLWLGSGLVAVITVGLVTVIFSLMWGGSLVIDDPTNFNIMGEELLTLLTTEVIPATGVFLIVLLILGIGLLLAYVIVRILFVVYFYQLKDVKVTTETELPSLPVVE